MKSTSYKKKSCSNLICRLQQYIEGQHQYGTSNTWSHQNESPCSRGPLIQSRRPDRAKKAPQSHCWKLSRVSQRNRLPSVRPFPTLFSSRNCFRSRLPGNSQKITPTQSPERRSKNTKLHKTKAQQGKKFQPRLFKSGKSNPISFTD